MDYADARIYTLLGELAYRYPDIKRWYRDRILPRANSTVRVSLGCLGDDVCGISIADLTKNKLCTLYVRDSFRGMGLGNLLIAPAFTFLNTNQPYFTCSEAVAPAYTSIITRYKWTCKPISPPESSSGIGGRELGYNVSHRRVTLTN